MKYYNILFLIVLLIAVSCKNDMSLNIPESRNGKLSIKTDKTTYVWQPGEDSQIIIIEGELKNSSLITFFSQVGDSQSDTDFIFFAGNSSGKLEKYNPSEKKWDETSLPGMLIEGTRMKEIEPAKKYAIFAHLSIRAEKAKTETGRYRLRIDYADHLTDASAATLPLSDYSNEFEIRASGQTN